MNNVSPSTALLCVVIAMGMASGVRAESPALIPVQGFLSDAKGAAVEGTHRVTFSIFDAKTSGKVQHTDDFQKLDITNGAFVAYLGTQTDLDLGLFQSHGELWLEVVIDGTEIITPRMQLGSVPYAAYAQSCGDTLTVGGKVVPEDIFSGNYVTKDTGTVGDLSVTGALSAEATTVSDLSVTGALSAKTTAVSDLTVSGTLNTSGSVSVGGALIRKIARAHGLGPNDGRDSGAITARTLAFTKTQAATAVRITYTDNLDVASTGAEAGCRWEIKFNGASCVMPGALVYDVYAIANSENLGPASVAGTCLGLAAGNYNVSISVATMPTYAASNCYTGWNQSYWAIEAEEVF